MLNIDSLFPNENESHQNSFQKNKYIHDNHQPSLFQSDQFKQGIFFAIIVLFILISIITIFKLIHYSTLTKSNIMQKSINIDQSFIVNNLQSQIKLLQQAKDNLDSSNQRSYKLLEEAKEYFQIQSKYKEDHGLNYQSDQMEKIHKLNSKKQILLTNQIQMSDSLIKINKQIDEQYITKEKNYDLYEDLLKKLNMDLPEGRYGSIILRNSKQYQFLNKTLALRNSQGFSKGFTMRLRYRGTAEKNDQLEYKRILRNEPSQKATLILIKIKNGPLIGGYTQKMFTGNGYLEDTWAILFNIDKELTFSITSEKDAIYTDESFFLVFGRGDLVVLTFDKCSSNFPRSYGIKDLLNNSNGFSSEELILTDKLSTFEIDTLEDFAIEFK